TTGPRDHGTAGPRDRGTTGTRLVVLWSVVLWSGGLVVRRTKSAVALNLRGKHRRFMQSCVKIPGPIASESSTKTMNASPCRVPWMSAALLLAGSLASLAADSSKPLSLSTRSRIETARGSDQWQLLEKTVEWDPKKTAI